MMQASPEGEDVALKFVHTADWHLGRRFPSFPDADRLKLSVRQHANHKTRELAGSDGFERRIDACSLCGAIKKVIRRAAH